MRVKFRRRSDTATDVWRKSFQLPETSFVGPGTCANLDWRPRPGFGFLCGKRNFRRSHPSCNIADGKCRHFILVQQAHDTKKQESDLLNICETVTAPRIRKVIAGYEYGNSSKKKKVPGLGGSFTYARLGPKLLGEYHDFGDQFPAFEELAKYIFYTETSHDFDPKAVNGKTGRIGEHRGTAYTSFTLRRPARITPWIWPGSRRSEPKKICRKLVVYCEKIWLHREDLTKWETANDRAVRPMVVPFNLK